MGDLIGAILAPLFAAIGSLIAAILAPVFELLAVIIGAILHFILALVANLLGASWLALHHKGFKRFGYGLMALTSAHLLAGIALPIFSIGAATLLSWGLLPSDNADQSCPLAAQRNSRACDPGGQPRT